MTTSEKNKYSAKMVVSAVAILMATGCGLELEPMEEEEHERPREAQDIISDDVLDRIEDAGFDVYGGSDPPQNVEGVYQVRSGQVVFDERWDDHVGGWCDQTRTFEATDDPDYYVSDAVLEGSCSGETEGEGLYISGEGDCFTFYSREQGAFEGCERDLRRVMSGCVVEAGIEDFTVAQYVTEQEGESCEGLVEERRINGVDYLRIFQENLAQRVD